MTIKTKIIIVLSLTIFLVAGATTATLLRIQSNKILDHELDGTVFLGDIIERSIINAMLAGNSQEVQKILENIGNNKEILKLRILSSDGAIIKSKDISEVGSISKDYSSNSFETAPQKPYLTQEKTINYFKEIRNRKECHRCHNSNEKLNGIIHIKQDLSRHFATVLTLKKLLIFTNISLVLLVSIILSLLFTRFVAKPLKDLLATIHNIEKGNWQATVKVQSNDEIGILGQSFNRMILEMNKLYKNSINKERELTKIKAKLENKMKVEDLNSQLEFKIKELETANKAITSLSKEVKEKNIELEKAVERLKNINEIGRVLTSIIETDELMRIIIRTTADLINAGKVTMHLNNLNKSSLTLQYQPGIGIEKLEDFSMEINQSFNNLLNYGKPLLISGGPNTTIEMKNKNGSKIGVPLKMKGKIIGAMLLENKTDSNYFTEDELEILTTLSNQAMVAIENASLYENVKSNYFSAIQSLVNALEANDMFTKGHSERVRHLSRELGRWIGLDYKELEILEHASILHDIGKIGIDSIVLNKQGMLTLKEYSLIKSHPKIADDILGPIETLDGVREIIIQHHERYDGKGYPYGLKGEELSLKSRILSVVDTFDAMMSDRPYRIARTLFSAKEELQLNAGTQFDPYVTNAFLEMIGLDEEQFLSNFGYYNLQVAT
jgi:HD-GYP domain-containing protein (c-di-GMP phosphodiesterase class II)